MVREGNYSTRRDEFLWSVEIAGYYNTATDAGHDLIVRERSYTDSYPSC